MEHILKVGGFIYSDSYYGGVGEHKIVRETATTYVIGDREIKVDKPFKDGCYAKGDKSGWGHKTRYFIPNYELLSKLKRQQNNHIISKFRFDKLSNEDTQKLVDFLETLNQTQK